MTPTPNKYNAGRALLKSMNVHLPNYLNHSVYSALERHGYAWDTQLKKWVAKELVIEPPADTETVAQPAPRQPDAYYLWNVLAERFDPFVPGSLMPLPKGAQMLYVTPEEDTLWIARGDGTSTMYDPVHSYDRATREAARKHLSVAKAMRLVAAADTIYFSRTEPACLWRFEKDGQIVATVPNPPTPDGDDYLLWKAVNDLVNEIDWPGDYAAEHQHPVYGTPYRRSGRTPSVIAPEQRPHQYDPARYDDMLSAPHLKRLADDHYTAMINGHRIHVTQLHEAGSPYDGQWIMREHLEDPERNLGGDPGSDPYSTLDAIRVALAGMAADPECFGLDAVETRIFDLSFDGAEFADDVIFLDMPDMPDDLYVDRVVTFTNMRGMQFVAFTDHLTPEGVAAHVYLPQSKRWARALVPPTRVSFFPDMPLIRENRTATALRKLLSVNGKAAAGA